MTLPFGLDKPSKAERREQKAIQRQMRAIRRSDLRERAAARAGDLCEWTGCQMPWAHMAHIEGIGRGGDPKGLRDTDENVMMLCVWHHDLLDGRQRMSLKEVERLLVELNQRRHG